MGTFKVQKCIHCTLYSKYETPDNKLISKIILHLRFLIISIETQVCIDIRDIRSRKTLIIESLDEKKSYDEDRNISGNFHPDFQAFQASVSHYVPDLINLAV